jgi:tRNA G18 (ribose-2'-O)-methylase SpoU
MIESRNTGLIYIGRNTTPRELEIYGKVAEGELMHFYEPEPGLFIAESTKVTERALDAGYRPVSLLLEKRLVTGEAAGIIERCQDVPVYVVEDAAELKRIVGFPMTRGVLCAMRRRPLPTVEAVAADARRIVVLGDVENPANVGTIFRSAAALGADAVLLTGGCGDPLYRRSVRVSMGTVFQVPWAWFDRRHPTARVKPRKEPVSPDTVMRLRTMGFKSVAMALREGSLNIDDKRLMNEDKLAIILGEEGEGLPPEVIDCCDYTVCIPMCHGVDSLNVAAAGAVAIWQLCGRHG